MKRALALTPVLCTLALLSAACAHVPSQKDMERARLAYDSGVVELNYERPQSALREFQNAVSYNPRMAEAHNALGLVFHKSYGRLDDAEKSFRKAVSLRSEFSEAWNNLGVLLSELGRLDEAEAAFEKALSDPHYKTPFFAQSNLGWVYHLKGRSSEGKQLIRNAILANPRYCMGHKQLAQILEAEGNDVEAELYWERYAEHCPNQPEALLRTVQRSLATGDLKSAWQAAVLCVEKEPHPSALECRQILRTLPPMPAEADSSRDSPNRTVRGARDLSESR